MLKRFELPVPAVRSDQIRSRRVRLHNREVLILNRSYRPISPIGPIPIGLISPMGPFPIRLIGPIGPISYYSYP